MILQIAKIKNYKIKQKTINANLIFIISNVNI